jgi:hypothetical protein
LAIHGTAQVPEKLGYKKRIEVAAAKPPAGSAPAKSASIVMSRNIEWSPAIFYKVQPERPRMAKLLVS